MAKGDFLWCDLSAFRVADMRSFYSRVFGWTYQTLEQPDGSAYDVASTPRGAASAIFEMPETFRKMGLPSFWMSYIGVDNIDRTVAEARRAGGQVEMGPLASGAGASIALIRDPLGAGFTVYQGTDLAPRPDDRHPGHMVWNALYVSDAGAVKDFYETLFGWRIGRAARLPGAFQVKNALGREIAAIHELSDEIRGRDQFWGVSFAVSDVSEAKDAIRANGGEILSEDQGAGRPTVLAGDPDGAAFFLEACGNGNREGPAPNSARGGAVKWKTLVGLLVIFSAVVLEQNWVWGVLFILWTVPAIRSGETDFVEPISRRRHPILYWLIVLTWIGLSLYLIAYDFGAFRAISASL